MWQSTRISDVLDPSKRNYSVPTVQSRFVTFFHAYPRFGHTSNLQLKKDYFISVLVVALPWFVLGIVALLFAIIANLCCTGVARKRQKSLRNTALLSDTSHFSQADKTKKLARIFSSVVLVNFCFFLLGIGYVGNHHFDGGALDTIDVIETAVAEIAKDALAVMNFVLSVVRKIITSLPNLDVIPGISLQKGKEIVEETVQKLDEAMNNANHILDSLRTFATISFIVGAVVFLLLFFGLLLLFSTRLKRRSTRRLAMAIYIFPLILSWLSVGVITSAAVLAADACRTLGDFQRVTLVQAGLQPESILKGIDVSNNLFISKKIQCPKVLVKHLPLETVADSVIKLLEGELATTILKLIFKDSSDQVRERLRVWLLGAIKNAVSCRIITDFSARVNYAFCHKRGPMPGLFATWISLILLAFALTISYILTIFTSFEASRFLIPKLGGKDDLSSDDLSSMTKENGHYPNGDTADASPYDNQPRTPPQSALPSPTAANVV